MSSDRLFRGLIVLGLVLAGIAVAGPAQATPRIPAFKVDAAWPHPLPDNWILGQVAGIAVDSQDHIWIVHRPNTLEEDEKGALKNPPQSRCCKPAPPVLEFDQRGKLLRHWGGPGAGYEWPKSEHGILVDAAGNVYISGNGENDHQVLKFTGDGKFLQQFGKAGSTGGSNSTTQLGRPALAQLDAAANELYIADGYLNRRILVLDATTGAYKRHWGGSGKTPNDDKLPPYSPNAPLPEGFGNPVHCVRIARDGLVYVCDRSNDRIQVFDKQGHFKTEFRVEPQTLAQGSVWDLVLSGDQAQSFIFLADGVNEQIVTLDRQTGKVLSSFGQGGRMAGEFKWVHNIAIDSKGNLYTAEVGTGRRAQRFVRVR